MSPAAAISLRDVSKWYGEVIGVSRVTLDLAPGVTCLVGPNGSGKSTLLNLLTGLIQPSMGTIAIHGISPSQPEELNTILGACTQHDTFPTNFTGLDLVTSLLRVHGHAPARARELATRALDRVGLAEPRTRHVGSYSKGMRQRLKLALALAHEPRVLVLDEPLNGLDPVGRSEMMQLFSAIASDGATLLVSSHVLHEVDAVADTVLMMQHGYLVAEGVIEEVRSELRDQPFQVRVTSDAPGSIAARSFGVEGVVSARVQGRDVLIETFDALAVARLVGHAAASGEIQVDGIEVADETVQAVYDYLIKPEGTSP